MDRRTFVAGLAAGVAGAAVWHPARAAGAARPHVVVVGGGFGGATVCRYLRLWDAGIDVTMVERHSVFVSCPMSNLVLSGDRDLADNTFGYEGLERSGVKRVQAEVSGVDPAAKQVVLGDGTRLSYDRLVRLGRPVLMSWSWAAVSVVPPCAAICVCGTREST